RTGGDGEVVPRDVDWVLDQRGDWDVAVCFRRDDQGAVEAVSLEARIDRRRCRDDFPDQAFRLRPWRRTGFDWRLGKAAGGRVDRDLACGDRRRGGSGGGDGAPAGAKK